MKSFFRNHYHWIIMAVMLLQMGIHTGVANNNGLFLLPVCQTLEISRSSFSLMLSLRSLTSFLVILFSGSLIKRFGYRKLALVALPIAIGGYMIYSWSQNLGMLCVGAIMDGLGQGFCGSAAVNRVLNDWFHKHRGKVMGIVSAASGFGGTLCTVMLSGAMNWGDWRSAYMLAAILIGGILLLNILFVQDDPRKMALLPYGEGELHHEHKQAKKKMEDFHQGYSFQQLLRKPVFYLFLVVLVISFIAVYLPNTVIVPHMQDRGLTEEEAVSMQGIWLMMLAVAKIVCGVLIDRIGVRWTTVFCLACGAVSMWLLTTVMGYPAAFAVTTLYSFSLPIVTITIPVLTLDLFGYHSYVTAVGVFSAVVSIGSMLASPISNAMYDLQGDYTMIFRIGAIAMLLMIFGHILVYMLADRDKKRWNMEQVQKVNH